MAKHVRIVDDATTLRKIRMASSPRELGGALGGGDAGDGAETRQLAAVASFDLILVDLEVGNRNQLAPVRAAAAQNRDRRRS